MQLNELEKATNAAYTYFTHNPEDEVAKSNYKWYISEMYQRNPDFVPVDREAYVSATKNPFAPLCNALCTVGQHTDYLQDHTLKFDTGVAAYNKEEWSIVIAEMERAVTSYLDAENQCRRNCEKPFDMGWFPEFVVSMSSNDSAIFILISFVIKSYLY